MAGLRVERFASNPIVRPGMDARVGDNVNGPSLVRAPSWVERPLGRYYLYFGHHDGEYLRLAIADDLAGPWRTHPAGVLPLEASLFGGHVASPDVHVNEARREVRLYYHGSDQPSGSLRPRRPGASVRQFSRVALSSDGLSFRARPEELGRPYFRVFRWGGWWYALAMPGVFYRSRDGLTGFEEGPTLFGPEQRHTAVLVVGDALLVFFTSAGDCPERILLSRVALTADWAGWRASDPIVVLEPETGYEGVDQPLEPSRRGLVIGPVRQLRDPALFREDGRTYLLYAVAGESGIAV